MNDGYFSWYRAWRFSLWILHTLTGAFALVGIVVLFYLLLSIPDLHWMAWFLPLWFLVIFCLVFTSHLLKWKYREDDEQ